MNKKIIFIVVLVVLIISLFIYFKTTRSSNQQVTQNQVSATTTEMVKVYENIELKNQSDFKLIGQKIYKGGGYEPGFNFEISLAGQKFGVDLTSQYGDTHYVGYLGLVGQSTTTKVFAGNVLDKNNAVVAAAFKITTKKCYQASGSTTPYTVDIVAGTEKLNGCAEILN